MLPVPILSITLQYYLIVVLRFPPDKFHTFAGRNFIKSNVSARKHSVQSVKSHRVPFVFFVKSRFKNDVCFYVAVCHYEEKICNGSTLKTRQNACILTGFSFIKVKKSLLAFDNRTRVLWLGGAV